MRNRAWDACFEFASFPWVISGDDTVVKFFSASLLILTAALAGCRGPAGPMGPEGTGSYTTVFSQNFDGAGYNPSSQFVTLMPNSGSANLGLDSGIFVSAGDSLKISTTGGFGPGGSVLTAGGEVPSPAVDTFIGADIELSGLATPTVETEMVFIRGGSIVADAGYNTSNENIYSYNGGNADVLFSAPSLGNFHSFLLVFHVTSGKSDFYFDGLLLGQNLSVLRSAPVGAPSTCIGFSFPNGLGAGDAFHVDNLIVYHF